MGIKLKDVQKWYADKLNKGTDELDEYDLFCAKVAYDYACEQLSIARVVPSDCLFLADDNNPLNCIKCGKSCFYH